MTQLELPLPMAGILELEDIYELLEPQARQVLLAIARRLKAGQHEYGIMNVHGDGRDYFEEAAQEALDFAVYHEMHKLKCGGL